MNRPRIYADFHNADAKGRVRLNCAGTSSDLAKAKIELCDGLLLTLYTDDADSHGNADELEVTGVVEYSRAEKCWVACVDWNAVRHVSEIPPGAGVPRKEASGTVF